LIFGDTGEAVNILTRLKRVELKDGNEVLSGQVGSGCTAARICQIHMIGGHALKLSTGKANK